MADGIRIKIGLDGVQQVQAGAAAAAQSLGQVGTAAGRTGQQTAQLSAQIQDFFVQVQAGGNPLTALIQQGSQLSAVYGGVGNAFRAVTGLLTPAVVAIGGLAAGVGALALAYKQGSAEADAYNRALILTGNIAGTTSGQLKEMAKAQAAVAGTQGKAAEVLAQLAASGQVAASELGKAASAAIRLERAGGPAAEETAKKFAELGKSPLQAVVRLNEAENFLTVSVYKQIRALEIQGKQAEAAAVAQKAYAEALEGRGKALDDRLGTLQKLWRDVGTEAKRAWDFMLNIGREQTTEEKLANVADALGRAQKKIETRRGSAPRTGLAAVYGGADDLRSEFRGLDAGAGYERLSGYYQGAAAKAVQKEIEQNAKNLEQQAARAQAAYAVMAARIKGDIEQIQSALKQGLSSPIEAIEREGGKRGDLLKAELSLLQQQYAVAKDTVGGQTQATTLLGQISAKRIDIANEEIATQNKVKEAIYATKKAAAEFYRQEQEEADRAIAEDKLKNRDTFNAKFDQASDYAQSIDDANAAIELQTRLIGANDQARAVAIERLRIEQEEARKLLEIQRTEGLLPEQRDKLNEKVSEAAVRARGAAEAKAYLEEYQRIYDDLRSGLTDALIEGGKSARDYLRSLFRNLVLQPLLRPLVSPVAGFIASATAGTSFADTGAAGGASGTFGQIGTAANLYSAGQKLYEGFASGFAEIGTAAKGAYFSIFESGAVGSANAAQIAAASGEAGYYGSAASGAYSTAAGTSANASLVSNVASTAAGVAVGVMAGRALSGGYSAIGGNSGNTAVNVGTAIGAIWGPIGAAVGGIIGGVVNRAFGRKAPQVEGRSIEGSITGGDFAGNAITTILEKGGWLRSDKRTTDSQAITGDLDKALDEGAKSLVTLATKYGDALGLPVTALGNVTAAIKVKITDDAAENTKAIADALGQYADALLGTFADQIEPFRKSGETVAQTIERVGGALLGVNDVLTTLGLTALSASLDGGKAALALTDLFGGASNFAQSAGSYYQKFYSEAERADRATAQITKTLADFGIQAPTTRDAYRALVEAQDLTTAGGQKTFAALLSLADAFDAVQTASDGAAEAAKRQADETAANNKRLQDAISNNIGKFLPFDQQQAFGYQRVSSDLAAVGVNADASVLQNATKDQILEVARAFLAVASNSIDAKLAIVEAAGALADLKDAAAAAAEQAAKDAAARIASLQSNVDSVAADFLSPQELVNYRATRIQEILAGANIETTVAGIIGSTTDTVRQLFEAVGIDGKEAILQALPLWKALNDSLTATSRAVAAYRSGTLADAIEQARLSSLSPADRVARLRGTQASLFEQLSTSDDPVAVAQRLAGVITALASEESKLTEAVRTERLNSLRDELDAAKSIKDVITGLPQFTSSLKFGDLSPLSAKQQLSEAQKLFDSTLVRAIGGDKTAASNLQTNAQALISEAISAFGSGAQASAVFERTTAALEAFTAQVGPTLDPKISTLEAQLAAQEDTAESSAAMLAALLRIDSTLAGRAGTATTTATGGTSDRTGETSITDLVTSPGPVETATLIAAQTAELSAQTARLGTIVANTAQTVTTLQTSVADQREGYLQLIARQRATEDALQQILSELRGGRVPA